MTLVEVMIATLVVGTIIVSSMQSLTLSAAARQALASEPSVALALARNVYEATLLLPRDGVSLDDLDGMRASPPVDVDLEPIEELESWSQDIEVAQVPLDADDPSGTQINELTVEIRENDVVVGTWSWWLPSNVE